MNVFLLLHPVKAEMNTRIKTRFGDSLGCFLSLFVVNWLQLPLTHLIVSSLIGILFMPKTRNRVTSDNGNDFWVMFGNN